MLSAKLNKLENDIKGGLAPDWVKSLYEEGHFKIIKDLGNASIHPNGGDINRQSIFDQKLTDGLDTVFGFILYSAFDAPAKRKAEVGKLKSRLP